MSRNKYSQLEIMIKNPSGLHARPASLFVKIASAFKSDIVVEKDGEEVNGKSILALLMLAAGIGSKLRISAIGDDSEEALAALQELADNKFHEG
jgi:phosphocarrier protein